LAYSCLECRKTLHGHLHRGALVSAHLVITFIIKTDVPQLAPCRVISREDFLVVGFLILINVSVIQTILTELTDSTNESKAMPLVSVTWSIGCIIGPLLGGSLAHPAERWPSSPFNNAWFRKYPCVSSPFAYHPGV